MRRVDPPPARGVANANRPSRQPQPIPLAGSVAAQRLGASDAPPVRVGVIGLGFGADVHIPALQQLQETALVAVCSLKPEDAHLVAAQHLVPHVTTDARALINHPEVEAVIIATPPSLHHSMAITAIEAGKPLLLETPMARSHAEARDLVKMAERAKVVAMVNHEFRHIPVRVRAKELVEEGFIGEPHSASMIVYRSALNDPYGRKFGWLMEKSKAGGMLGAAGSHHIDALRWWFGEVNAVTGGASTMVKQRRLADSNGMATVDADDNFSLSMRFKNGALGTIHYSATSGFDWGEQIILSGSEGMLIIQGDDRLFGARRKDATLIEMPIPDRLFDELGPFEHYLTAPTARMIQRWVQAIRNRDVETASFEDGAKVQEIMEAVTRAGAQGRWVDVSGQRWPTAPTRPK